MIVDNGSTIELIDVRSGAECKPPAFSVVPRQAASLRSASFPDLHSKSRQLRMASLFVTGARGLVGRALLRSLPGGAFNPVTCLTRDRESLTRTIPPRSGWRYIEGDLDDTASWVHALPGHEVVLHLAAATGKASGHGSGR